MKNNKIVLITILIFLNFQSLTAQNCDCGKDFTFLQNAYLSDYAGIQDFKIVHPEYLKTLKLLETKAKEINQIKKCDKVIEELIKYFNNGHIMYAKSETNPFYKEKKNKNSKYPSLNFTKNIAVLKIPDSDLFYKKTLDSILNSHKNELNKTQNLIIDLRGNGGGGDAMFNELIPFLYTNPILVYTAELWTSANNIKLFEDLLDNPNIPKESKESIQKIVSKGKSKPNSFIGLSENRIDTLQFDSVSTFPKKVNIIIDKGCKSATEQFILLAKQSKKVKIFGYENSGGALDYANLNVLETPSKLWIVTVPTTRTTRLPENPVDPIGIKPDILIERKHKNILNWIIKHK